MRFVDIAKIKALKDAGWQTEEIAIEMNMKPDAVENALHEESEKERNTEPCQENKDSEDKKTQAFILLTSGQLKKIYEKAADIGAREALKVFEEERKKEYAGRADRRLRNTRLLLRNYHMLKEHAENSVFGRTQMEESALDILESMMTMYDNEIIIESIKRSATRTAVIVSHIETMFGLYEAYCDKAPNRIERRRYEVLWDMYMAENTLSAKEIADKQDVSKDTIYADLRMATEKLSSLIFGIDGLKIH